MLSDEVGGCDVRQSLHFSEQLRTAHADFLAELRETEILIRIVGFDDGAHFLQETALRVGGRRRGRFRGRRIP